MDWEDYDEEGHELYILFFFTDKQNAIFYMFFDNYHYLDVVDTGYNDCYSEEYAEKAQRNADQMNVILDYVEGSNHLLEKLINRGCIQSVVKVPQFCSETVKVLSTLTLK